MYWSVVSTPRDHPDVILAKWKSVRNHVLNNHAGHDDLLFPKCVHGKLRGREARKKWLELSTKPLSKPDQVILKDSLLRDIRKLIGHYQTSAVQAFCSLVIPFAPKSIVFSYLAIDCRLQLAKLHYNANGGRQQAKTKHKENYSTRVAFSSTSLAAKRQCKTTYVKVA